MGPQTAAGLSCQEHWDLDPSNQELWGFGARAQHTQSTASHRVPLGPGLLLLETGELTAIVDGDEKLPDEQGSEADEQDGTCHREQDHQDIWPLWTVWSREEGRVERDSAPPGQLKAALGLPGHGYMELLWSQGGIILFCQQAGASTLSTAGSVKEDPVHGAPVPKYLSTCL